MNVQKVTDAGRAQAESRMLDTGRGVKLGGTYVDPDTLETVESETLRFQSKFRISSKSNAVSEKDAAGQQVTSQALILSIPTSAPALFTDDVWIVEAVDADTGDPSMVGRRYRVAGQASGSQATASRYPVELLS
jgi:hypothetical protein